MLKLNAKGFAHWVIPAFVVVVIGGAGSYVYLHKSSATIDGASVCGNGYKYLYSVGLATWVGSTPSYKPASVQVYKNTSVQKFCMLNMATGNAYGVVKPMSIKLNIENAATHKVVVSGGSDSGNFKYYAGPVYVKYTGYTSSSYKTHVVASMTYKNVTSSASNYGWTN